MGKGYNPGQARDDRGRWTSGRAIASKAKSSAEGASGLNGKDPRKMTSHEKVLAAEVMFGKGSKQHLEAKRKWQEGRQKRARASAKEAQANAPKTINLGKISRTGVKYSGPNKTRSIQLGKTNRVA